MTKADMAEKMAKDAGIPLTRATIALKSIIKGISKGLQKKDGMVTLVGLGTFAKVRRKARKGRNPQTGEPIEIKAMNVVKFKPGKALREGI